MRRTSHPQGTLPSDTTPRAAVMAWLAGIICIILIVAYWRIFLPVALIAAACFAVVILYVSQDDNRSERRRKEAQEALWARIARAQATSGNVVRTWKVEFETDPAGGQKVPRYASVRSDDGLCRLQVEERIDRSRLTAIYCSGLKVTDFVDIQVKFDDRSTSDPMKIYRFSDGDAVYIPSDQYASRYLAYNEFLRRMGEAHKVSLRLNVEEAGPTWITFSLAGSAAALTGIGALPGDP